MQSWGPFGPPPKSWDNNDPFGAGADPFTPAEKSAAKPADPWASAPDPWATAPSAHQHQPSYADPWGAPAAAYPMPMPFPNPKSPRRPAILIGSATAVVVVLALVTAGVLVFKQQGRASASEPVSPAVAVPTTELTSTYTATTTPPPTTTSALPLPTGEAALGQHRIFANFDAGLAEQPCNPVGWPSDTAAAQIFYQTAVSCMDTAWKPLITAAGMEFRSPKVSLAEGCDSDGMRGFAGQYCSKTETLYVPLSTLSPKKDSAEVIFNLAVLAHEYGHHVQHLIGTLGEMYKQARALGEQSEPGLELSRRMELQAQCFSGMFVGSIVDTGGRFTTADYQVIANGNWDSVSPRDHGSPEHYGSWWDHGYRLNKIGECNTWLSPASDVS
ncbi:neutral zinc metallopeptidase [Mycobacteroides abscessus subsp. abscessus]|uniref:neutral zinc metallopeptidase n=4 Tax=Mycolicibacterium fortuitum TaxID=1766 RepID=UPI001CDD1C21|nr:neutral zinc metallopeptidase [Mycolicibacterium fortuitum]MDO3242844.1 neutral zinc metallopeptidase [Mycobacteroides abscessus subsp. abscessus]MCA4751398.1 neutral zinc metallopeptidase [Mycolicibacterium fortuitum]MDG5769779.1 neutral zinc metallopeptidase [Mycolicibacterium fortuitum]MDG5784822.1 neutral zinc metallopeptidase [Mycolicibacterium fortuitum]UBV17082.1 neutral zinc metallopeptidase [Mycolicibacterium fortuitum]